MCKLCREPYRVLPVLFVQYNQSINHLREKNLFSYFTSIRHSNAVFKLSRFFFTSLRSGGKLIYGLSMTSRIEWMCCIDSWQNVFVNRSFMLVLLLLLLHFYKCLIYFVSPENSIAFWRCCFYKIYMFLLLCCFFPLNQKILELYKCKKLGMRFTYSSNINILVNNIKSERCKRVKKKLAAHFVALLAIL